MVENIKGSQYIAFALIFLMLFPLGESSSAFLRGDESPLKIWKKRNARSPNSRCCLSLNLITKPQTNTNKAGPRPKKKKKKKEEKGLSVLLIVPRELVLGGVAWGRVLVFLVKLGA